MEDLQRDIAPESRVRRTPDDAHPALAELLEEAIAAGDDVIGLVHA